jgi:drug/metabolite transporter (DMT)-like permease
MTGKTDRTGILFAMVAAVLFGAAAPFSKGLLASASPQLLAGLLYLGSGLGLSFWIGARRALGTNVRERPLRRGDAPWLAGAVVWGGIAGPLLLLAGLARTPASTVSLLLNLEGVLTALLAWFVFRENVDRRVFIGMTAITAGGAVLSWGGSNPVPLGALLVVAACLAWAVDNNLTRPLSAANPALIAAVKGMVAGTVNLSVALLRGESLPPPAVLLLAGAIGLFGYGVSLNFFVLALRHLGTARTGAYFSLAPFVGAFLAIPLLGEWPAPTFPVALTLMAVGVWLHLTERHDHLHRHEPLEHEHRHIHDEHHVHDHPPGADPTEPHSHPHVHQPLAHAHSHYPDLHHAHDHERE